MEIKITILQLDLEQTIAQRDISKIRGFFANNFSQYTLLHNHLLNNSFSYHYPLVQYKILNQMPTIIGINEGGEILEHIYCQLKTINFQGKTYPLQGKSIKEFKEKILITNQPVHYEFISPWLALNEKNFQKYTSLTETREKAKLQEKILIGNMLTLFKRLNFWLEEKIQVTPKLKENSVNFKNQSFLAFKGFFSVNLQLPDYLGLGKSCSRGFGTFQKCHTNKF